MQSMIYKHVKLEPISNGDCAIAASSDQSIFTASQTKRGHWKKDKTQSAAAHHTKSIKKTKVMIKENNQQSQINFPTWETMQKLGDVLQLWVIK